MANLPVSRPLVVLRSSLQLRAVLLRRTAARLLAYTVLIAGSVVYGLPLFWMISTSLKPTWQIFVWPPQWIPTPIVWGNYPAVFTYVPLYRYAENTVIIATANVAGGVLVSALTAYAFAILRAPGRNLIFMLVLGTMMIPGIVLIIPTYIIFAKIHWVNTLLPLTVPPLLGGAFDIFLLRQFFLTIPLELQDSALIDGASHLRIWWSIVMPLSKPALATVGIFRFLGAWNDFFGPLIYLNSQSHYTLALGLQVFESEQGTQWGLLMAASTMVVAPVILVFFFAQKQFIQGIVLTGMKA
ncbi:MAG: carbohydrate ABC transporter permease [Chloroflexi bacterium]|nr:carbohydrate ABC transporter permease [Chloroflexota bacterium]